MPAVPRRLYRPRTAAGNSLRQLFRNRLRRPFYAGFVKIPLNSCCADIAKLPKSDHSFDLHPDATCRRYLRLEKADKVSQGYLLQNLCRHLQPSKQTATETCAKSFDFSITKMWPLWHSECKQTSCILVGTTSMRSDHQANNRLRLASNGLADSVLR